MPVSSATTLNQRSVTSRICRHAVSPITEPQRFFSESITPRMLSGPTSATTTPNSSSSANNSHKKMVEEFSVCFDTGLLLEAEQHPVHHEGLGTDQVAHAD